MLIHFVHGEKGGVGKSWFARLLVDCCLSSGWETITLVESDSSNPDVGRYFPEITEKIFFSEDDKRSYDVDRIFQLAETRPVLVNLPAQVDAPLNDWIERNGLLDEDFDELEIYKWFVCTGEPDSVALFKNSTQALNGKIRHVLVKNMGRTGAHELTWNRLATDNELLEFVKTHNVVEMTLDPLHAEDADIIVVKGFSFDAAINSPLGGSVSKLAKRRLKVYREKVFTSIRGTGLLSTDLYLKHLSLDNSTQQTEQAPTSPVDDSTEAAQAEAALGATSGKGKKGKSAA
ncbi:MAG TPA: hypothetical protein DCE56_13660 [Cyanobacteria bacterium UBA8553]|nr:hypothetical protein [Cyanobacteria bacterium UBA8553]